MKRPSSIMTTEDKSVYLALGHTDICFLDILRTSKPQRNILMGEGTSYWVVVYRCPHPTRTVSQRIMKACKCKHILNCEVQLSKQ